MAKRKISDYYRSTKRRRNGRGYKPRVTKPSSYRRRMVKTKRRLGRGSRYSRSKKSSNIRVTKGNLRSYTGQVADRVVVGISSAAAGATDTQGKQCTWYYPGCNSSNFDYGLGCMNHIIGMATVIETDEQSLAYGSVMSETKFLVKDSQQAYDIVNCSDAFAKLSIYHCTLKRDVINTNSQYDFIAMLGDGFFQRGQPVGGRGRGNQAVTDATFTPFHSHKFCSYIHVTRVETLLMDPGQVCQKKIQTGSYNVNMEHYTTATAANNNSTSATLDYSHRRGERFLFIKVEGQPANDSTNRLTYTSPAIDVITTTSYTYQSVNRQAPLITKTNAINFLGPATVQIMEDETGAVIPQANA